MPTPKQLEECTANTLYKHGVHSGSLSTRNGDWFCPGTDAAETAREEAENDGARVLFGEGLLYPGVDDGHARRMEVVRRIWALNPDNA